MRKFHAVILALGLVLCLGLGLGYIVITVKSKLYLHTRCRNHTVNCVGLQIPVLAQAQLALCCSIAD